jgi:lipid-A-disaccharide synthase
MRAYVDHVLCLLPFEPAALARLDGPPGTYVGHPLIERAEALSPRDEDVARRAAAPPLLVLTPGSRRSELDRLLPIFDEVVRRVAEAGPVEAVLPVVRKHAERIAAEVARWPVQPRLLRSEAEKHQAFRQARAALAASGTVTLELALAGVPTVVAYKVSRIEAAIARRLVVAPSIVLPNLILERNVYPEFLQDDCAPAPLAAAVTELTRDGQARAEQLAGLADLRERMRPPGRGAPSDHAARVTLALARA